MKEGHTVTVWLGKRRERDVNEISKGQFRKYPIRTNAGYYVREVRMSAARLDC